MAVRWPVCQKISFNSIEGIWVPCFRGITTGQGMCDLMLQEAKVIKVLKRQQEIQSAQIAFLLFLASLCLFVYLLVCLFVKRNKKSKSLNRLLWCLPPLSCFHPPTSPQGSAMSTSRWVHLFVCLFACLPTGLTTISTLRWQSHSLTIKLTNSNSKFCPGCSLSGRAGKEGARFPPRGRLCSAILPRPRRRGCQSCWMGLQTNK